MNLRDEIKTAVLEELYEERNVYGYGDESRAADAILVKVREALLSDEAIVAAQRGITSYVWDPENQEEIIHRKMLGATRSGIKEALDSLA